MTSRNIAQLKADRQTLIDVLASVTRHLEDKQNPTPEEAELLATVRTTLIYAGAKP